MNRSLWCASLCAYPGVCAVRDLSAENAHVRYAFDLTEYAEHNSHNVRIYCPNNQHKYCSCSAGIDRLHSTTLHSTCTSAVQLLGSTGTASMCRRTPYNELCSTSIRSSTFCTRGRRRSRRTKSLPRSSSSRPGTCRPSCPRLAKLFFLLIASLFSRDCTGQLPDDFFVHSTLISLLLHRELSTTTNMAKCTCYICGVKKERHDCIVCPDCKRNTCQKCTKQCDCFQLRCKNCAEGATECKHSMTRTVVSIPTD